jgi:hypothetical protein
MVMCGEVEREAWPTFGRPYFAANDTETAMHNASILWCVAVGLI